MASNVPRRVVPLAAEASVAARVRCGTSALDGVLAVRQCGLVAARIIPQLASRSAHWPPACALPARVRVCIVPAVQVDAVPHVLRACARALAVASLQACSTLVTSTRGIPVNRASSNRYGPGGRMSVSGKTVTIFGGTGFLGRYLANRMGARPHATRATMPVSCR